MTLLPCTRAEAGYAPRLVRPCSDGLCLIIIGQHPQAVISTIQHPHAMKPILRSADAACFMSLSLQSVLVCRQQHRRHAKLPGMARRCTYAGSKLTGLTWKAVA